MGSNEKRYTVLIERWKREALETEVAAPSLQEAIKKTKENYFGLDDELDFIDYDEDADFKDERLTIYDAETEEELVAEEIDSGRNVFKRR
ncbi:MAG: hypothetical protein ACXV2C_07280 [Candidatus Bathyarchaeia archaeon]